MHFVKHLSTSIMNFNNIISKGGGGAKRFQGEASAPLNETLQGLLEFKFVSSCICTNICIYIYVPIQWLKFVISGCSCFHNHNFKGVLVSCTFYFRRTSFSSG